MTAAPPPRAALLELADAYGIATEFWDWQGHHREVSDASIIAVLAALDVDAGTVEAAAEALRTRWSAPWRRLLPPTVVARIAEQPAVVVHAIAGERVAVWVDSEDGRFFADAERIEVPQEHREIGGRSLVALHYRLPAGLPLGYHRLKAWCAGESAEALLVVTPDWLGVPPRMGDRRLWGVAAQLYSVRSEDSWGTGDLADLVDLATWTGGLGAGFVLINPLHAAEPTAPMEPSPYLPSSRRFSNPLYLRPERIPEAIGLDTTARERLSDLRNGVAGAQSELLDRDAAWTAKREVLEAIFRVPRSAGRTLAFAAYREREGAGLVDFALWSALADTHGGDWRAWPAEYRSPVAPAVSEFRRRHADRVEFHAWLQWALDEQLAAAQMAARRAGMTLGVMHDLAVGVNPAGADTWSLQDVFAAGVSVGAPPDAYNQNGQDWTQPPWRPDRLAETGYEPFRRMVSTVLRSAGGLRVDHIIGLFRLWWIPAGLGPLAGTYVRYDHEALTGILALEAYRAGALVVGEDLGTVEPWVRDYLTARGIFGTSILWFEYDLEHGGGPLPAERWREYCLASVTTHDLPPTAGYLAGEHVRIRDELGLLTRSVDEELAAAEAERAGWLDELRLREALTEGAAQATGAALDPAAAPAPDDDVQATLLALHRYLTWTPAKLIAVALTDMVGDRRAQNQPGTHREYPNWKVPLTGPDGRPVSLEQVFASERAAALARASTP